MRTLLGRHPREHELRVAQQLEAPAEELGALQLRHRRESGRVLARRAACEDVDGRCEVAAARGLRSVAHCLVLYAGRAIAGMHARARMQEVSVLARVIEDTAGEATLGVAIQAAALALKVHRCRHRVDLRPRGPLAITRIHLGTGARTYAHKGGNHKPRRVRA